MDTQTPGIGHNAPPNLADEMAGKLVEAYGSLTQRAADLTAAFARVPATVDNEDVKNKCSDFVKQLRAVVKDAESHRVAEKEPFLATGKRVDGFFKGIADPLDAIATSVLKRMTAYDKVKAEAERREREEEARRQREEADRLAKEAREKADAMKKESDMAKALEAEEAAKAAAAAAAKAEKATTVNAAELSRTRSAAGSVASLRTFWTFRDLDRATLDLETLRAHLPQAALDQAVRSFVKAGGRDLKGVVIFEDTETVVR
jgi:hypothetical protein